MFKPVSANQDFIEMEEKWLKHWYENDTVKKYLQKNKDSEKRFSFQDGPITANNPMGVHHAWGRTYKDLWQRFHNLLGYKQRFQNGFDCQGLWIEVEVEKELGLRSKKDIENLVPGDKKASIAKFVQLCKDRVYKYAKIQTEQSKRLGYFMDWDHSYFTMSDENNYMIWHFLKRCFENGWIYKGKDSVPWCPRCETAISQHEMLTEDYKEVFHEAVYFKLPIRGKTKEYLLVWTTTPWTIPANIAVAVDKDFEYVLVEVESGEKYFVLKELVDQIFSNKNKILQVVRGKDLVGLQYKGPFDELEAVSRVGKENPSTFHTVIATDPQILPISKEEGTGLVHTAVSAGTEDFRLGKLYGLPMIPVISDNAEYLEGLGFLSKKNAKKNPRLVLDYLQQNNWAYKIHNYKHRYPGCWRCKTELVWKVTDEWYIAMDKSSSNEKKTLRQRMITVAKKINWLPEFGLERELDWLKNMHDWLISKKNRYWGLALPIYECQKCGHFEVIGSKEELKERAVKGWNEFEGKTPHKPYIDEVYIKCEKCNEEVRRIDDVGNPWLDAGIVPFSTITQDNHGEPLYLKDRQEWEKWFPIDFITESFPGQFKNWFYSLIAMSTALEDSIPTKTILGFGTLLGEDGRPMHKSWGNAIEFNEGAKRIGVDVMRWMYVRQNPADNLLFGYKKADEVRRQFYLILWNTYKYFIDYSRLEKFVPKETKLKLAKNSNVLDKWILSRFNWLIKKVKIDLEQYSAKNASREIERFVNDLSTWYIRRSRDRIWVNSKDLKDKEGFYSTLYSIMKDLAVLLTPFLPFASEEMYSNLSGEKSVHLSDWPLFDEKLIDKKLEEEMEQARHFAELAHARRKEKGVKVRQPLASLTISGPLSISEEIQQVVASELNVKKIKHKKNKTISIELDTAMTPALQAEGKMRDLVRQIQAERKRIGAKLEQKVDVYLQDWPKNFEDEIKQKALIENLTKGSEFKVVTK